MYSEDMYSVLNCRNVVNDVKFCLGMLRFNETPTANAGCFKRALNGSPNVTASRGSRKRLDLKAYELSIVEPVELRELNELR
jgi:hypothetical protein